MCFELSGCREPLFPFLGLFFVLWVIYTDPNFIHSYKTSKIPKNPANIIPKWLGKQALDHHASDHY
jgi:hypothetical protein